MSGHAENKKRAGCIRTIIADDSPEFLHSLREFLSGLVSLEIVGTGSNGHEALALAERLQPELAILDLEMPEMDGLQAAMAIREKFPAMRVIIVSIHDQRVWRESSAAAGVHAFVPKHSLVRELPECLKQIWALPAEVRTVAK